MPQLKAFIERLKGTPVDEPLHDNSHLDLAGDVRVIFTRGHISLYLERTRTLISGDALTANSGQLAGPNAQATSNLPQAMESVRKLAELDVQTTACYHGGMCQGV